MSRLPRKIPDELIYSIRSILWVHESPGDPSFRIHPLKAQPQHFLVTTYKVTFMSG